MSCCQWSSLLGSANLVALASHRLSRRQARARLCGHLAHTIYSFSSGSSPPPSGAASLVSCNGEEITYSPLAHLPRSIRRQRSLQKGNPESELFTGFLQMGQRRLMERLRGIATGIRLKNSRHQVVVVRLSDLAPVKFTRPGFQPVGNVIDEELSINLGRVHCGPPL